MGYDLVAVGASWGGLRALERLLGGLPPDFPAAIVIAQHRMAGADAALLPRLLGRRSPLAVREIEDKEPIAAGTVYVGPADYHVLVERGGFSLSLEGRVTHSRPSVDVLLESAADAYRERVIGVILTGANADGASGLARVRARGGVALVQDPRTAEKPAMPEAAIATGAPHRVLSVEGIAALVAALCRNGSPRSGPVR